MSESPSKLIFLAALQWRLGHLSDAEFRLAIARHINRALESVFLDFEEVEIDA